MEGEINVNVDIVDIIVEWCRTWKLQTEDEKLLTLQYFSKDIVPATTTRQ